MRVLRKEGSPRRSSWPFGRAKAGLIVMVFGASSLVAFGQQTDAPQVLAAARTALGGEKNLGAVKAFVARCRAWGSRAGASAGGSSGGTPSRRRSCSQG